MPTSDEKQAFLKDDLRDSLRWLFVGAIAWEASQRRPELCGNQNVLGMYTSLVQARSLYDFFYKRGRRHDDAEARHFAPSWTDDGHNNTVYQRYVARESPANKRVFHLVYNRSEHAGGPGHDGPDHLNKQVIEFANNLRGVTAVFIESVEEVFRENAQSALWEAIKDAERAAEKYGIALPF
jgi:hypothetical protein